MDDFREAMKQWILRAVNKGSFDKYFVYPDVDPVLQKYFDCEPVTKGLRYTRWIDGETYQVDVFIECEKCVFIIETGSASKTEYIDWFLEKAEKFIKFFPECSDKVPVPIYASAVFSDEILNYATKKGLYAMAYREWEYMDILNFEEIKRDSK
jgi:hypothetical protein